MTEEGLRKVAALGVGIGLVVGSLAMWHNDTTTATAGLLSGLALVAISLRATTRSHFGRPRRRRE